MMPVPVSINGSRASSVASSVSETDRLQAVNKLNARIRAAKLTNAFRARMSLATFKATHHVEQSPLSELENKYPSSQESSPVTGKRRSIESFIPLPGTSEETRGDQRADARDAALFNSLLSPPSAKRAKAAAATPHGHSRKAASLGSAGGLMVPPQMQSPKSSPRVKTSTRKVPPPLNANAPTVKDDMNAAATLTSLMMSSKASNQSDTSEKGLSRTSSDASAHVVAVAMPPPCSPASVAMSATPAVTASPNKDRHPTPPKHDRDLLYARKDKEAAELMMFLATSPSPARKSAVKHQIPLTAGRVLFPSHGSSSEGTMLMDVDEPSQSADSQGTFATASSVTLADSQSQLLAAPFLGGKKEVTVRTAPNSPSSSRRSTPKPGGGSFHMSDYIDISPPSSQPNRSARRETTPGVTTKAEAPPTQPLPQVPSKLAAGFAS